MLPISAGNVLAPKIVIFQRDFPGRWAEDDRSWNKAVRRHVRIKSAVRLLLGDGDVAGRLYEFLELFIRRLRLIDPETVDGDFMDRPLVRLTIVGAHEKRPAWNPNHAIGPCRSGRIGSLQVLSGRCQG